MKPKIGKRPKLSTYLKAQGWQFDGFLQCSRVFKHPDSPALRIVIDNDDHTWTLTTWPDCSGQIGGKGKTALSAQLKTEEGTLDDFICL